MKRSTDRILVTHQGTLPRPPDLQELIAARSQGKPYDEAALAASIRAAVAENVRTQAEIGIDIVNDGEMSKTFFNEYVKDRFSGIERTDEPYVSIIHSRDLGEFPEFFGGGGAFGASGSTGPGRSPGVRRVLYECTGPITYIGQAAVQTDIENLKAALQGLDVAEAYLPAVAPGSIEHWLRNRYYASDEEFLYALADAMHEEYRAIVDAGFILQVDDPDLADGWQVHADLSVEAYRKVATMRSEALNHALRGIPEDRVRLHMCWGSYHGPHKYDIPLRDIVDIILSINVGAYSIEASNPRHEHEWRVWEDVKLPDGKILIPGVVGHFSDFIEHPELVAERLVRYASVVGRENVIAGTDCGIGSRVSHAKIAWAKLESLVEGARLASQRLWR
jgi:5-methyltetrahydropteroyltriglutamate--homocysteine methyltransferase